MSMTLLKVVSRLTENKEFGLDSKQYNDIIHGKSDSYFNSDYDSVPITPEENTKWANYEDESGEFLNRNYYFANTKTLLYFINESIKYQESINHHAVMSINELSVSITLQTKDMQSITSRDLDLARFLDEIFQDTQFFYPTEQWQFFY